MKATIKAIGMKVYKHESVWKKIVHSYTFIIAIALVCLIIASLLWNKGNVIFNTVSAFTVIHESLPLISRPTSALLIISILFMLVNICFIIIHSMNYVGWVYNPHKISELFDDSSTAKEESTEPLPTEKAAHAAYKRAVAESNDSIYKSTFDSNKSNDNKVSLYRNSYDPVMNYTFTYKAKALTRINKFIYVSILNQVLMIISMVAYCNNLGLSWWSPNDSLLLFFAFTILTLCLMNGSMQDIYDFFGTSDDDYEINKKTMTSERDENDE